MKPRTKKLNLKFWGSKEAVEQFRTILADKFLSAVSPIRPSDQGEDQYHAFATLTLIEVEQDVFE